MSNDDEERKTPSEFAKEEREDLRKAWEVHKQFLSRFPFREEPESIARLTVEDVYNPGSGDYFFYWVEHKLKTLGHIAVGSSAPFRNASQQLNVFKELLRTAVDVEKGLAERVDARWDSIRGLGGDRHVAKKTVFLYNWEAALPIFKTEDLEHFCEQFKLEPGKEAKSRFGVSYDQLTVGQRYELLTESLLAYKTAEKSITGWDNLLFSRYLYQTYAPPFRTLWGTSGATREGRSPLGNAGLLFEPTNEQELVALFAMYHKELGFPYIVGVQTQFPDARVIDESGVSREVEFELRSSSFMRHNHPIDGCDYIVCWEDDWTEAPDEAASKIVALKDRIKDIL